MVLCLITQCRALESCSTEDPVKPIHKFVPVKRSAAEQSIFQLGQLPWRGCDIIPLVILDLLYIFVQVNLLWL
jgi:hypothetical protein